MSINRVDPCFVEVFNDDDSEMSFVIKVMMTVFQLDVFEATARMYEAHKLGSTIFGPYSRDIAQTKASKISRMAAAASCSLFADVGTLNTPL